VKLTSPSSVDVKECVDLYLHSPSTPSWRGAQLKHRDDFTFTFTFTLPLKVWRKNFIPQGVVINFCGKFGGGGVLGKKVLPAFVFGGGEMDTLEMSKFTVCFVLCYTEIISELPSV